MDKGLETEGKEEEIGYHKGALDTLLKEKKELSRLLNIVEQLIQMHAGALKEEGVDVEDKTETKQQKQGKEKPPIEDLLN